MLFSILSFRILSFRYHLKILQLSYKILHPCILFHRQLWLLSLIYQCCIHAQLLLLYLLFWYQFLYHTLIYFRCLIKKAIIAGVTFLRLHYGRIELRWLFHFYVLSFFLLHFCISWVVFHHTLSLFLFKNLLFSMDPQRNFYFFWTPIDSNFVVLGHKIH
jgi:hypothetical protein